MKNSSTMDVDNNEGPKQKGAFQPVVARATRDTTNSTNEEGFLRRSSRKNKISGSGRAQRPKSFQHSESDNYSRASLTDNEKLNDDELEGSDSHSLK